MSAISAPVPAAGIICLRGDEVLLVRRTKPPRAGEWSLPGGRIEPGETARAAALRELAEETGVTAELIGLVDVIDAVFPPFHYVLIDFAARWRHGEPVAGDDAAEARFFCDEAMSKLDVWGETRRIIEAARKMARARPAV